MDFKGNFKKTSQLLNVELEDININGRNYSYLERECFESKDINVGKKMGLQHSKFSNLKMHLEFSLCKHQHRMLRIET